MRSSSLSVISHCRLQRIALAVSVLACFNVHAAQPSADAVRTLDADTMVSRTVTLADLGITTPITLGNTNDFHEFYLPVPAGLPLTDARIGFAAHYLRGDAGTTTLLLSVDGAPVSSRRLNGDDGRADLDVALAGRPRDTGFVKLGVNWASTEAGHQPGRYRCEPDYAIGNVLTVDPETKLSFRYDTRSLDRLDVAWAALPSSPVVLVSGRTLQRDAFDTAWRVGVALERTGKHAIIRALPITGDTIDTRGLDIPAALSGIPAFAALARGGNHTLANAAEVGALLMLDSPSLAPDLVIADKTMQTRLAEAFDALGRQLAVSGDDTAAAFTAWRASRASLAAAPLPARQIALTLLGARPVIAVAAGAGAQAAGVFSDFWRHILDTRQATVTTAGLPSSSKDEAAISITALGGSSAAFDVVSRGDWSTRFALNAALVNGRMPNELVLDVAAAPGASSTRPVVSVFMNDLLLAAKQLDANGKSERLTARIPGYALNVDNTLRVSFQRQPVSVDCNEVPQGFPVNVLPSSYLRAGRPEPDGTFVGLLPLMGAKPALIIPDRYLADAVASLSRIVRLGMAAGISPTGTVLMVASNGQVSTLDKPFLALDVKLDGAPPKATLDGNHVHIDGKAAPWLDLGGVDRLSVAEVVHSSGQDGILWHGMGGAAFLPTEPFVLNRGDIAVIGRTGPVAWIDSADPSASSPPDASGSAFYEWRRNMSWGMPTLALLLVAFIVLLILAYVAARRYPGAKKK
jgi:hypothetical protein